MSSNRRINRLKMFSALKSPTPDKKDYKAFKIHFQKELKKNPKLKKHIEECKFKSSSILSTQLRNGINLEIDSNLRFFLAEFNNRLHNYGFGSMPSSFNVLESFYDWNSDLFLFELYEEYEHLFSFFDFVDFVTSKQCSNSVNYFKNNVKDDIIYSFNILNQEKEITFNTLDSKEYVIGGVSFIKHSNEVSMLIVSGEICDIEEFNKNAAFKDIGIKSRAYINPAPDRKREAEKLFNKNDLWKVLVYVRVNLDSMSIDTRYVQKDMGDSFITFTDDLGMFLMQNDGEINDELIEIQLKDLNNYEPIFSIIKQFFYLPEYFNYFEKEILIEEHPTGLINEQLRSKNSNTQYYSKYFAKHKEVLVLDRRIDINSKTYELQDSDLNIERKGYWKYLTPGDIGIDRNGKEIHGKTWVEQTITWRQANTGKNLSVKTNKTVSKHSGYIYLLRNASHDLNIFKIGLTTLTPEERAKQLSGTSSPDKFLTINRWKVLDCVLAEKLIHKDLDKYRINPKREFFKVSIEEAIKIISPIIEEINNSNH